jgi:hypothetical protein
MHDQSLGHDTFGMYRRRLQPDRLVGVDSGTGVQTTHFLHQVFGRVRHLVYDFLHGTFIYKRWEKEYSFIHVSSFYSFPVDDRLLHNMHRGVSVHEVVPP